MRNKMWWMLALLITGATMLVSCKDDDEKAVSEDEIAEDRYVEAAKAPTEDLLGVMVEGRTVVVEHDYEGVGAALVKRIKTAATTCSIQNCKTSSFLLKPLTTSTTMTCLSCCPCLPTEAPS